MLMLQNRLGSVHRPSTTTPLFTLNKDIFLELVSELSNKDLLATMQTCHALYGIGFPCLRGRHHYIGSLERLKLIHTSLVESASPLSFSLLRNLTLGIRLESESSPPESHADTILDILRRATGLKKISINTCILRCLNARFSQAVRKMNNFRRLEIWDGSITPSKIMLVTEAECISGTPALDARQSDEEEQAWQPVSVDVLPAALEELVLHDVSLSAFKICYPRLTRLTCHPCHMPRLSMLVPAFPHLEVLDLSNVFPRRTRSIQELYRCQEANKEYQRTQAAPQWSSLVCLHADRAIMYALELQCSVSSVVLGLWDCLPGDLPDLGRRLAPFKLQHLRLSDIFFHPNLLQKSGLLAGLKELCRLDLAIDLSYIAEYSFNDEGDAQDPHQTMSDGLEAIVKASRIRMLDCRITGDSLQTPSPDFDMSGLAHRLMKNSKDLSFIKLEMKTAPGCADRLYYCTIIRDEGDPYLRDVRPDDYATKSSIDAMFLPLKMPAEWVRQEYACDPDDYSVPAEN